MNIVTVIFTVIVLSLIAYFIYRIVTDKKRTTEDTTPENAVVLISLSNNEYLIYNKDKLTLSFTKDIQKATKFDMNEELKVRFKIGNTTRQESLFALKKYRDDGTYILSNSFYALIFNPAFQLDPEYLQGGSAQKTTFDNDYLLKAVQVQQ